MFHLWDYVHWHNIKCTSCNTPELHNKNKMILNHQFATLAHIFSDTFTWYSNNISHVSYNTQVQYHRTVHPDPRPSPWGCPPQTPPCRFPTESCPLWGRRAWHVPSYSWRAPPPVDLTDRSWQRCKNIQRDGSHLGLAKQNLWPMWMVLHGFG